MPYGRPGISEELAEVVTRVVGSMSMEQAAIRLEYRLTAMTVSRLRKGKTGLEATVRTFAEGFADRICEEYGEQIRERFGECDKRTAADWLAETAGFQVRARPARTYDPHEEHVALHPNHGNTGDISPETLEVLKALYRQVLDEARDEVRRARE